MAAALVVAVTSFSVELDGRTVIVHDGELYKDDDEVVVGREHLFEKAEPQVEQATAAPGEKRKR